MPNRVLIGADAVVQACQEIFSKWETRLTKRRVVAYPVLMWLVKCDFVNRREWLKEHSEHDDFVTMLVPFG